MNVSEAIRTKRAIRKFQDKKLPEDVVHAILNAGRRSQSSKNEQAWQFIAIRDKPGDFLDNTVRESTRRSAARLTTASPMLAELVKGGKLKIVAAHYDLDRGNVEFLT